MSILRGDLICSGHIIDAAMKVHSALGPGLLEGAYEAFLTHELRRRRLEVQNQVAMVAEFDGYRVDLAYRLDLLVERTVVVELKTVARLQPVHEAQLLSYLRLSGYPVGLLINFHVRRLKDGIRRFLNDRRHS